MGNVNGVIKIGIEYLHSNMLMILISTIFFGDSYDGPKIYFLDSQWGDTEHFYIKDKLVL